MSDLLNIGVSGLNVSKKALETTGHNLANANTEGYSRQRVHQSTSVPINNGGLVTGSGARIDSIKRVHDEFVEKHLSQITSEHNYFEESHAQLVQVENIFNEIDNDGLHKILNRFYNAFRELANQPENETIRSVVRDNAALVVKDFHRIRETIDQVARSIDQKIQLDVQDINEQVNRIASLNKRISSIEVTGGETGDLRDQRDLAISTLAKYFSVTTYVDNKGSYNVAAKGVGTLVSGGQAQELSFVTSDKDYSPNNMAGAVDIVFKNRPGQPISTKFQNGTFAADLKIRNEDIKGIQENIDQLAFSFIKTTNAIHNRGYVNRKIPTDAAGNAMPFDSHGPTTGIDFFKDVATIDGAALSIELSDLVKEDTSNIATGLEPNAPGDNRVAIGISKLQHEKLLDNGQTTIEEKFLKMIGNVGLKSGKAQLDAEQSEGILAQAKAVKERISGVSIDEETANMVRYQQAYDASAKVIKSADEMFKTVIGLI